MSITAEDIERANEQSLRDGFAKAALAGMLANPESVNDSNQAITELAWNFADFMLAERRKRQKGGQ